MADGEIMVYHKIAEKRYKNNKIKASLLGVLLFLFNVQTFTIVFIKVILR